MHPLVTARPPRYGLGWPRLPRARRRLPRRDRDMPRTSEPGAIIDSGEPSHLPLREGRPVPATILPEDGLLRLGAVALPAGRRVHAPGNGTAPRPVAWVTATPVPDPGRVWSRLSDLSEQTGLAPFLAVTRRGYQGRPWKGRIATDLNPYEDPAVADLFDAAAVLAQRWAGRAEGQDEYADPEEERRFREWEAARIAPFTQFPGLTPAIAEPLSPGGAGGLFRLRAASPHRACRGRAARRCPDRDGLVSGQLVGRCGADDRRAAFLGRPVRRPAARGRPDHRQAAGHPPAPGPGDRTAHCRRAVGIRLRVLARETSRSGLRGRHRYPPDQ